MNQTERRAYYEERIKNLVNLPTLPIIATEIIRISREDRLSINQMLPIIEKDPPLAMKVLKFANSPYYGLTEKVQSLRHAIVIIGLTQLTELATAFTIIRAFESDDESLPWRQFWEHSSATGFMAQLIAEELGITTMENIYSIGLLHDIGKLILYRVDPRNYREAYLLSAKKQIAGFMAEEEIFGFNHAEAGYWISEQWDLPQSLRTGIQYHHSLDAIPDTHLNTLVSIINLADAFVNFRIARFGTRVMPLNAEQLEGWRVLSQHNPNKDWPDFDSFSERIREKSPVINEMVRLMQG
jgi:putative nucleotidyltransferase with HDIG domain